MNTCIFIMTQPTDKHNSKQMFNLPRYSICLISHASALSLALPTLKRWLANIYVTLAEMVIEIKNQLISLEIIHDILCSIIVTSTEDM